MSDETHRLAFSHPSGEVGKVIEWLRSDVGKGSEEGVDWASTFADEIERRFLSTPETVSLKGDRV